MACTCVVQFQKPKDSLGRFWGLGRISSGKLVWLWYNPQFLAPAHNLAKKLCKISKHLHICITNCTGQKLHVHGAEFVCVFNRVHAQACKYCAILLCRQDAIREIRGRKVPYCLAVPRTERVTHATRLGGPVLGSMHLKLKASSFTKTG